jgi:hypothetical protein
MSALSDSAKTRPDAAPSKDLAAEVIDRLRFGEPPYRGVEYYSVGHDELLEGIRARHLESSSIRGKIRFVCGSWGSGKSHFLRELMEVAFQSNYLVSFVRLGLEETPFNRFEKVLARIAMGILSPKMFSEGQLEPANHLGEIFREVLLAETSEAPTDGTHLSPLAYKRAVDALMSDESIDIDFRRLVVSFWKTYLPPAQEGDSADTAAVQDKRGLVLQWFEGVGTAAVYRKAFGVQKLLSKDNARTMLKSLGRFALRSGHHGLLILFDEAQKSYSVMRKANLRMAHNNLLHLINGVDESDGLFLIYATTPDFYNDPDYGISKYGALSSRIGKPLETSPMPLDKVWNLDAAHQTPSEYQQLGLKIRNLYLIAFPEAASKVSKPPEVAHFVQEFIKVHPRLSTIHTLRALVAGLVRQLDDEAQGRNPLPIEELHAQILDEFARD